MTTVSGLHIPYAATLLERRELSEDTALFRLAPEPSAIGPVSTFIPGQFLQISVPGGGEIPISPADLPAADGSIDLCVRRVGHVTELLHKAPPGTPLGIRGPFGTGFPVGEMEGHPVLLLAGGLGIAPLRSLLVHLLRHSERYGEITLMYGARQPRLMLFRDELAALAAKGRLRLYLTVDFAPEETPGNFSCAVGLLPDLLKGFSFDAGTTYVAVCGPPPPLPLPRRRPRKDRRRGGADTDQPGAAHALRGRAVLPLWTWTEALLRGRSRVPRQRSQADSGGAMNKPRLAIIGLTACSGCQLTLLNCEDELPEVAAHFDLVHFPTGESGNAPHGQFDVAIVEGAVSTPADLNQLFQLRNSSRILIALGTCALHGGVAAMNNGVSDRKELLCRVYGAAKEIETFAPAPLSSYVTVDFAVTGCPPEKHEVLALLAAALAGTVPPLPSYPVCIECRSRENLCLLLERNELCLGPVIQGGCNARCPATGIACEGCRGPVRDGNVAQELELLLQRGHSREEIERRLTRFKPEWDYGQRG